ncbi:MAG: hypothetical protein ACREOU_07080 [Candidatus Eiseniibacteriota bacterium]
MNPHGWSRKSLPAMALVVAVAWVAAPPAQAAVPDPSQSIVEPLVVASWTADPSPACAAPRPGFDVIVRDAAGMPVAGATVALDFSPTIVRLYLTQNPGTTVNCAAYTLSRPSDAIGIAHFVPRFGGFENSPAVVVSADGIILAPPIVARSPDFDRNGTVALTDLVYFARSYLSAGYEPETDFDGCPASSLADLSFFAQEYLTSTNFPPAVLCP